MFDLEFFGASLGVELAGQTDAHESDSSWTIARCGFFEELVPKLHGFEGQGHDDFFSVREVVVDGSFGVLHQGCNAVHGQGLEAFGKQNGFGHPKDLLGSQLNFALFSGDFDHAVNY